MTNLKIKEMTDTKNMVDFIVNDKKILCNERLFKIGFVGIKKMAIFGRIKFYTSIV